MFRKTLLGKDVKVYVGNDITSAIAYRERPRNTWYSDYRTFVTDGQLWEDVNSFRESSDPSYDPDGFWNRWLVRNASFILYKVYDAEHNYTSYELYLRQKPEHNMWMLVEQYMLDLLKFEER